MKQFLPSKSVGLTICVAGAVAGILVGIIMAIRPSGDARADEVEVRQEGRVVAEMQAADAIQELSRKVGFEVKPPTKLPDAALKLKYVEAVLGPEGLANSMNIGKLGYEGPGLVLEIQQTKEPFGAPTDRATQIDIGLPGVTAYHQSTEEAEAYWVLADKRGVLVVVGGQGRNRLDAAALSEMLRSLATA